MGHNYLKNDANRRKSVMSGNFIEFPSLWCKPHCSKLSRLEMTSKTKLIPQVENCTKKLHFRISWFQAQHYQRQMRLFVQTLVSSWYQVGVKLAWK